MKVENKLVEINLDTLPIEELWNNYNSKPDRIHNIHSYPAKFPSFITTEAINYARQKGIKLKKVADIFCGCGTASYESIKNNVSFWGCDINPVATLIARTKSNSYNLNKIMEYFLAIKQSYLLDEHFIIEENENERIKYWFDLEQILKLSKIKKAILKVNSNKDEIKYKDFFLCGFSNILKASSYWLAKSIKPQIDKRKKIPDAWYLYEKQINMMLSAIEGTEINANKKVEINTQNFLEIQIDKPFVDLIVTSPPYVTSYEYADLHQLSTIWLDYAQDFRAFRKGSIGSLYHDYDYKKNINGLNSIGKEICERLIYVDKQKTKSVIKYFMDMQETVDKSYAMIRENGMILFVIGNTEYKNVKIDNAKHLILSMQEVGFSQIEIYRRNIKNKILTPYRDVNGKFSSDKNSRKVYSEEFIIIGRKLNVN